MSWSFSKMGRANKLAEVVAQQFRDTGGCPPGTEEEAAKNKLGEIAESLCANLVKNPVVRIQASGSAWNEGGKAHSHAIKFELETVYGDFVE